MFNWALIGKSWKGQLTEVLLHEKINEYKYGRIKNKEGGRLPIYKTKLFDKDVIVKQYGRGGFTGRILPDLYLTTKVFEREMKINEFLTSSNFNTAEIAAIYSENLKVYCIVESIKNSVNLKESFKSSPIKIDWSCIGKAIGKLHLLGVFHPDLNMANILITDEGNVFIIDFIGSSLMDKRQKKWRINNFARLLRSYLKEGGKLHSISDIIPIYLDSYNKVCDPLKVNEVKQALKRQMIFHSKIMG